MSHSVKPVLSPPHSIMSLSLKFSSSSCLTFASPASIGPCDTGSSSRISMLHLSVFKANKSTAFICQTITICLMDRGGLHRGTCRLRTIQTLCHIHWMCFNSNPSFWSHYIYCSVHPGEGSSSVLSWRVLHFFSPWRVVWEFFLIRCEVKGQGCLCVQIVKHTEANL